MASTCHMTEWLAFSLPTTTQMRLRSRGLWTQEWKISYGELPVGDSDSGTLTNERRFDAVRQNARFQRLLAAGAGAETRDAELTWMARHQSTRIGKSFLNWR